MNSEDYHKMDVDVDDEEDDDEDNDVVEPKRRKLEESQRHLLDFSDEFLVKIIEMSDNDKNLSLVNKRFYELITKNNEDNVSLEMDNDSIVSLF
jgi:hypothetical protein